MIWATVSSWSCFFCWLYRPSPSLGAKNMINLISVLTIWWYPCVESSLFVGRGCLLWPMHSLGKTLLDFALLHSLFQVQICLLLQVFLDFLLLHYSPLYWASLVAQRLKHLPPMQETRVQSLGCEDPLEKEMATHSSIVAWRIPWTEEAGGLQSTGSQRVRHDWVTLLTYLLILLAQEF